MKIYLLTNFTIFFIARTEDLIATAGKIKQTGATGAYSHEFESMEEKIEDVRKILLSANMTSQSLISLQDLISQLRQVTVT